MHCFCYLSHLSTKRNSVRPLVILDRIPQTKRCEKVNLWHKPQSEKWEGAVGEKFPREKAKEQTNQFYLDSSETNTVRYANTAIWKQKQMNTSKMGSEESSSKQ